MSELRPNPPPKWVEVALVLSGDKDQDELLTAHEAGAVDEMLAHKFQWDEIARRLRRQLQRRPDWAVSFVPLEAVFSFAHENGIVLDFPEWVIEELPEYVLSHQEVLYMVGAPPWPVRQAGEEEEALPKGRMPKYIGTWVTSIYLEPDVVALAALESSWSDRDSEEGEDETFLWPALLLDTEDIKLSVVINRTYEQLDGLPMGSKRWLAVLADLLDLHGQRVGWAAKVHLTNVARDRKPDPEKPWQKRWFATVARAWEIICWYAEYRQQITHADLDELLDQLTDHRWSSYSDSALEFPMHLVNRRMQELVRHLRNQASFSGHWSYRADAWLRVLGLPLKAQPFRFTSTSTY